jgi:hypothetical protein
MIDFVKKSAGKKITGFEANFGTIFKLRLDAGLGWARDFAVNSWNRKAALVIVNGFTLGFDDFWVE